MWRDVRGRSERKRMNEKKDEGGKDRAEEVNRGQEVEEVQAVQRMDQKNKKEQKSKKKRERKETFFVDRKRNRSSNRCVSHRQPKFSCSRQNMPVEQEVGRQNERKVEEERIQGQDKEEKEKRRRGRNKMKEESG